MSRAAPGKSRRAFDKIVATMRLLFVSEATGWSGGANQIWLTATRLIQRGHAVAVACRPGAELSNQLERSRVPVLPFVARQDYDLFGARRLSRLAADFKAQLVHAHHPRAHALCLLATLFGLTAPLVVTRRVIKPVGRNPFSRAKYNSRRIARYVAVCDAAAEELKAAGVGAGRIEVIPSGVDFDRWEPSRNARPSLAGKRPRIVMMVAHQSPIKGHSVLLKAIPLVLREVPDARFRLVGRGTEALRAEADALGVNGQLELLGDRTDVPELLTEAHLFVMPSLQEGIGTALIEAQAGLVPVVASRVGGLPQVVDDGRTGTLLPPGDERALAAAIAASLQDPERTRREAAAGFERVSGMFSIDSVVDRLERLYQSLA